MIRIQKNELHSSNHELWIDQEDVHFIIRDGKRYTYVGNSDDCYLFLEVPMGSVVGCRRVDVSIGVNDGY